MADTLRDHYLGRGYDFFVHIASANSVPVCYQRDNATTSEISFDKMIEPPKRSGALNRHNHDPNTPESASSIVNRLEEAIRKNAAGFVIFLENFEWIANLYEAQADTTWISKLKNWENLRNTTAAYALNMAELDEIAHGMSVGEKTLCACMRILRKALAKNPAAASFATPWTWSTSSCRRLTAPRPACRKFSSSSAHFRG